MWFFTQISIYSEFSWLRAYKIAINIQQKKEEEMAATTDDMIDAVVSNPDDI
jgi:hypothetical protein